MIAGLVRASGLGGRKVRTPLHASEGVTLRLRHEGEPFEPAALRVKGNAPGNARGLVQRAGLKPGTYMSHGQCHREYTAGGATPGDSPEENLRDVFMVRAQVRVKRWSKSPPRRQ